MLGQSGQILAVAAVAVLVVGVATVAWYLSERQLRVAAGAAPDPVVPPGVGTVLSVLRSSAVVIGHTDEVLQASAPAYALGLVRDHQLAVEELAELVTQVRRDGEIRQAEVTVEREDRTPLTLSARVAPLGSALVLVLVEDRTRERQVERVRRDFVANVSHELKTPVGALRLLAEAVSEAADDPEAVRRFGGRMVTESDRLARLVQQIIELSRLQGDDPLESPAAVDVDKVVSTALDTCAIDAAARDIALVSDGRPGLHVLGSAAQVTTAVSNLVANAVAYSPEGSQVVVSTAAGPTTVDICVVDQGIGIPATEVDRIFERFYRVDPARHRSTGGTGLGLSIVKHIAATHGGDVKVWSAEGHGSTFTLSLPRKAEEGA